MLIALVNNQRTTATPKLKGLCPGCHQPVTAKCGPQRAWHWAHLSKRECDSWWEETEWHRFWKNLFPLEWQEIIQYDPQSGEKHIADVRTAHGLVIEFQHSPLDPQERMMREAFYKNMIWVVDLSHLKRGYKRFAKEFSNFRRTNKPNIFLVSFPDECFPTQWTQSKQPVFFDFKGSMPSSSEEQLRTLLWCLLPRVATEPAVLIALPPGNFVKEVTREPNLVKTLLNGRDSLLKSLQPPSMVHLPRLRRRFRF